MMTYYFAYSSKYMKIKVVPFNNEQIPLEKVLIVSNAAIYVESIYYFFNKIVIHRHFQKDVRI